MKAILEFNLPEDIDDWNMTKKVTEYYLSIEEVRQFIRSKLKYESLSDESEAILKYMQSLLPLED